MHRTSLHSTMLLLYRSRHLYLFLCLFSLHSTMLLLYPKGVYWISPLTISFTFHYASTISNVLGVLFDWDAAFTFHYASTISLLRCLVFPVRPPLHSTMLLLYLTVPSGISFSTLTLHSTMLLLYQEPS